MIFFRYPYTVDGAPMLRYLKENCYKDEITEFNAKLEEIGRAHGWTRRDLQTRFSNELLDQLFFDDLVPQKPVLNGTT